MPAFNLLPGMGREKRPPHKGGPAKQHRNGSADCGVIGKAMKKHPGSASPFASPTAVSAFAAWQPNRAQTDWPLAPSLNDGGLLRNKPGIPPFRRYARFALHPAWHCPISVCWLILYMCSCHAAARLLPSAPIGGGYIAFTSSNVSTISFSGAGVARLTSTMAAQATRNAGSSS